MIITMNQRELHRLETLNKVLDKHLSKVDAAQLLNVSIRQLYRLIDRYKKDGVKGLVSKKRGQPSNRSYPDYFKKYVLDIIKELYIDFGPTLAAEKHGISLAIETSACGCVMTASGQRAGRNVNKCISRAIDANAWVS